MSQKGSFMENRHSPFGIAIILAGGQGVRMKNKGNIPKQYWTLGQMPVIMHSVHQFLKNPLIASLIIVLKNAEQSEYRSFLEAPQNKKKIFFVDSGKTRQESSYRGLSFMKEHCPAQEFVAIHDAARPFISQQIITSGLQNAQKYGSAIPVLPVRDSLVRKKEGSPALSVDRKDLFVIQTPQCFRFSLIWKAHNLAKSSELSVQDDSSLLSHMGQRNHFFEGDFFNFKITDPSHYKDAQQICDFVSF